ncbi:MAG: competence protein ComEA [Clostridia bacterium]|jgi:competence protein ComEA|nr:competence protein ComEA [Clostridia bacterium]MDN5321738.1 competence protein ComEA [Clostridia bacterium]
MFDDIRVNKQVLIIILVVTIALSFWAGAKYAQWRLVQEPLTIIDESVENEEKIEEAEQKVEEQPVKIFVHITGAVKKPGVYQLQEGARLEDLLKLAIPTEEADVDTYLNRAALLYDQEKITVYKKGEKVSLPQITGKTGTVNNKININNASLQQLETLIGIGPTKARAIVDYRNNNGRFNSIEELMNVKGIGQATFDKLKDQITVN